MGFSESACDRPSRPVLPQVFVANPNKPKPILDILLRNKDKLVEFLTKFHTDRSDDEQFNDEKAYLIKQIRELKAIDGDGLAAPASGGGGNAQSPLAAAPLTTTAMQH